MNIWGWLVVLGAVGASVGFVLYGMGTSTLVPDGQLINTGRLLLLVGLIALAVGFVAYKANRRPRRSLQNNVLILEPAATNLTGQIH